ncbi:MAG TPA: tRNA (adenosine(37)-N6)-dimethylallyltransferase MiaA [Verrucomicrobiota bacterium]|nr:tRNA (adenosine(37)-N6)-dimethylallyltransferase MiaA [Verrucomicrobiota bacterium]HNU52919.1 tRNA (adenosine(37)-N6)-dimethylallyltransferase MiaA [Verrucomicrobiota bacterium]
MNSRPLQTCLITGPTAVGKSAVALALARRLGAEIVSVDSMQVYRGLDIGTGKPSAADRLGVPHHLLDVVGLDASFDAAQFTECARAAVREIHRRGRVALLVGGTGLYFKAFLAGLGQAPPADARLRATLEAMPIETLLSELASRDPAAYARIDRRNRRRIVRAVEVIRLTGRPFSAQQAVWTAGPAGGGDPRWPPAFCLTRAPEDLRGRIHARIDAMIAEGWVDETRRLLGAGLEQNRFVMQAIGYAELKDHLRGRCTIEEAVAVIRRRTWQYARRQMTWFRHQLPVEWVFLAPTADPQAVAADLAGRLG